MDVLTLDQRLSNIEELLLSQKRVLTIPEASIYSGIAESYLYKLVSAGKITHSKPGGKCIYFDIDDLNTYLLSNKKLAPAYLSKVALSYTSKNRR
jgi:excisionase family DNA binding protein